MKLSEVTLKKTHLIFEDETDTRTPEVGTTTDIDGKTYKWRGQMWTEVKPDGSNGRPAPTGVGNRLTSQWRTSNPVGRGVFKLTPGVQQLADDRFMVTLPDTTTVVNTTTLADAEKIQARVDDLSSGTPAQISNTIDTEIRDGKLKGDFKRSFSLGRAVRNATAEDYANVQKARSSRLGRLLQNRMFKVVIGLLGTTASIVGPFWGMMVEIENINLEIEQAEQSGGDVQRLQDIRNILQGQLVAYYAAQCARLLTKIRFVRALMAPIRSIVRAGQLSVALTGAGAPAAFLSMIVTEALWIVIPLILSTSSIQRWLAEIIVDSTFKDIFVNTGRSFEYITNQAAIALDGKFGTGALAKAVSGFDPKETEGVTGEYYGESEWAKLVFGTLLFPPSQKSRLVPYIPEGRRETLLTGTLGLNPIDASASASDAQPAPGATPEPSSQPGMPVNPDAVPGPQ